MSHQMIQGCHVCHRGIDIVKTLEDCRVIDGVDCWDLGGRPCTCPDCKKKILDMIPKAEITMAKPQEPEIQT